MKLRPYQSSCLKTIKKVFKDRKRQLIQLPTGAGKSLIFLKFLKDSSKKSLIVVPTIDLVEQISESALHFFKEDDILTGEQITEFTNAKTLTIVTSRSLSSKCKKRWFSKQKFDHIVMDEAHRAYCPTFLNFLKGYEKLKSQPYVLGCTATPERLDKKSLLDIFGMLSYDIDFKFLIERGFLCDIEAFRIKTEIDLDIKKIGKGDIAKVDLKKFDMDSRNQIILSTYLENCTKRKTLIFCVSIEHCDHLSTLFKSKGIKAESIHGKLTKNKRQQIIKDFKSGKISVLCNCQLLTEGFDEPSIEDIIIARPTFSKSLYCQMIGRALRPNKGKKIARLYELTDNNHDICRFDVSCDTDDDTRFEYTNGTKLSELKKQKDLVSLQNFVIKKEKFLLFDSYEELFKNAKATKFQKNILMERGINFWEPITFHEAAFLLWYEDLKEHYGIY